MLDAAAGQAFDLKTASRVAVGAHVGHDAPMTEAVRVDVMAFLRSTLLG